MYVKKAQVLVFVLDAADSTRFPLAKSSLHRVLASEPYLPLVLLANKQVNTHQIHNLNIVITKDYLQNKLLVQTQK